MWNFTFSYIEAKLFSGLEICVHAFVCCVRERERERERDPHRHRVAVFPFFLLLLLFQGILFFPLRLLFHLR
jgi:hypothetical protein